MECANGGNDCSVKCASGGNDCSMECVSGGNDCSVQCANGVRYLMRGGTPWDVLIECGRKQGPNCKRISMGVDPLCGHLIWHKKSQHLQGGCWIMLGHKWQMEWQ
jgi:hypothetical protein